MVEVLILYIAQLTAGVAIGLLYFGGLWLTVRALPSSRHPGLLWFASYFVRLVAAFAALLLVALVSGWQGLLVSLAGYLLIKLVLVRRLGPSKVGLKTIKGAANGNQS